MKFSYKFSNLLGTVYHNGNLVFTPDGNSLISPVGNRLTIHDLKNNKARTLSLESLYNYDNIALSPDGNLLIAINENGEAQLITMLTCTIMHRHKFRSKVQSVIFSPCGSYFAVARENLVFVFISPSEITGQYNPFQLHRYYLGGYDVVTSLEWSSDSRFLAIGCRDNSTKINAIRFTKNFRTFVLSGHTSPIVGAFFEENSLDVNTVSSNGQLCLWECSRKPSDLEDDDKSSALYGPKRKRKNISRGSDSFDFDIDTEYDLEIEKVELTASNNIIDENEIKDEDIKKKHPFTYKKLARFYLAEKPQKENPEAKLTAANYQKPTKILVVGFSTGAFFLYELPDVNMIHSLRISEYEISSAIFNVTGDWIALASRELGQLLVWEWQSEQYILKQQGHTSELVCMSYSPGGQYIATGGEDSKVKLWSTKSGFCFITFNEHTSSVTDLQFSRSKKFLVSSSLDGTVRAFDINRYRNFRTFTSPQPIQFSCVAIDYSSEFVAAAGQDIFDIFLWSIKLGSLLEVVSSHEGPVSSLAFSPVATSSTLVSSSWDKTIKIWNCLESNSLHETIDLHSDALCVTFNPNGTQIAVGTLSGNITIFDVKTASQIVSIEGRNDLIGGRLETDTITAEKNLLGKHFTSIAYSVDGDCILAGGNSNMLCIYHVKQSVLLKKFEITQNHSFDGINDYINHRKLNEFGNLSLVEHRENLELRNVTTSLPGVQKGDMASRNLKREVEIFSLKFAPTGQSFGVVCTEGLCIFSLDNDIIFDSFYLSLDVTPKAAEDAIKSEEYSKALIMSLKLNDTGLIRFVLERVPYTEIKLVCSALSKTFVERLISHITSLMYSSTHIEFYLCWCFMLLTTFGSTISAFPHHSLLALQEALQSRYEELQKICDFNTYTMKALLKGNKKRFNF